jgi:NhaP-type Na+/H+ or K+/H+ antiporter
MPLLKLSWEWALTLGFVLSAVSPAVVVPGMLSLQARGYGTGKGIPTLVMAAASFDDVLAISGFGISLAFALAHEEDVVGHKHTCEDLVRDAKCEDDITSPSMAWLLLRAPLELLLGAGVGALFGFLLSLRTELTTRLTREHLSYEKGKARYTAAVLGGATLGVLGGKALGFSGGGVLCAVTIGCAAGHRFPERTKLYVQKRVNDAWMHLQPALFGLLGVSINLRVIDPSSVFASVVVIVVGLCVRVVFTRIATLRSNLTSKEAWFICVAWLPKATVQAAIGGTALDLLTARGLPDEARERGQVILMVSVIVILITAPIGAIGLPSEIRTRKSPDPARPAWAAAHQEIMSSHLAAGIAQLGPTWLTYDGPDASNQSGTASKVPTTPSSAPPHRPPTASTSSSVELDESDSESGASPQVPARCSLELQERGNESASARPAPGGPSNGRAQVAPER